MLIVSENGCLLSLLVDLLSKRMVAIIPVYGSVDLLSKRMVAYYPCVWIYYLREWLLIIPVYGSVDLLSKRMVAYYPCVWICGSVMFSSNLN